MQQAVAQVQNQLQCDQEETQGGVRVCQILTAALNGPITPNQKKVVEMRIRRLKQINRTYIKAGRDRNQKVTSYSTLSFLTLTLPPLSCPTTQLKKI